MTVAASFEGAGSLPYRAASSVASDQVLRSERSVAGQPVIDAAVVLREARHLGTAKDRCIELSGLAGQAALVGVLPQGEPVGVPSGKVTTRASPVVPMAGSAIRMTHRRQPLHDEV
jgi:hypothetical protein